MIVRRDPRNFPALNLAGFCLKEAGRPADALALFQRASAVNDLSAVPVANAAGALLALGRRQEAAREYRRALALDPAQAESAANLARLLREGGDRPGALAVDLVHHDDGLEAEGERLARDESRLRHRALDRVHQQHHAVDHREHALDLAAEIRVAGRVHDVDVHALVVHRRVLGEDGDAALLLDVAGVHDALDDVLVRGEGAGLLQELVDQRGLAVVDVGDDGDVAKRARHGVPKDLRSKSQEIQQFSMPMRQAR